jgi:hypothetical protein
MNHLGIINVYSKTYFLYDQDLLEGVQLIAPNLIKVKFSLKSDLNDKQFHKPLIKLYVSCCEK